MATQGSKQPLATEPTALSNYLEGQVTTPPAKRNLEAAFSPGVATPAALPSSGSSPAALSPFSKGSFSATATFGIHAHRSAEQPALTEEDAEAAAELSLAMKLQPTPAPSETAPTMEPQLWTTIPAVRELPQLSAKTFAGRSEQVPDFHPRRELYLALMCRVPTLPARWAHQARDYWKYLSNHSDLSREAAALQWAQEQGFMVAEVKEEPQKKSGRPRKPSAASKSKSTGATAKSATKGPKPKAKAKAAQQNLRRWSKRFQAKKTAAAESSNQALALTMCPKLNN